MQDKIQIVILAGGKGKRMMSDEPKALALLQGRPFLSHILKTVEFLNLTLKPIIVVGHKKERIFEELGENHNYAHQEEQLGTGHAVHAAKEKISENNNENILVISTDQPLISKETIENLMEKHLDTNATITLATVILPDFEEWRKGIINFGRIVRDTKNKIDKIIEYKDANEEEKKILEVNPAIYIFKSQWLWKNIENLKNENSQNEYYLTDLLHIAKEQGELIETVPVSNILEALQPNTKEELEVLETLVV